MPRNAARREPVRGIFRLVLPLPFPGLDSVNTYLIPQPDGATLVDAGIYQSTEIGDRGWDDVVAAFSACDVRPSDVQRLIVTHSHIDHYGMAGRFVAETGCELWMHEAARKDLELLANPGDEQARVKQMLADHGVAADAIQELVAFEDWRGFLSSPVAATRWFTGDETFTAGEREWSVVYTPGHARSHICLFTARDGILIAGDHVLPRVTPHIDFVRGGNEDPLGEYLASLERVVKLAPGVVLPGHGRPFEDGAERARVIARHHERRLGAILHVVRRDPHTADYIVDEIFGATLMNFQRRLALGEALAHLAYLRVRGEVERLQSPEGTFLYRKASSRSREGRE